MRTQPYTSAELERYQIPGTLGALDKAVSYHTSRLQSALDAGGNTHDIEDVRDMITQGRAYLFSGANAVIVAEIIQYPRKRVLNFWLAAGDLSELIKLEEKVSNFGKSIGIFHQEFRGRFGWRDIAKKHGWTPITQVWVRDVRS